MYKIDFSYTARLNLLDIFWYIAEDNYLKAIEVQTNIKNTIDYLKDFPNLGKKYIKNSRRLVNSKYKFSIIYKVSEKYKKIEIISIFKNENTF